MPREIRCGEFIGNTPRKKGELLSRIPEEQGVMPRYLLLSAQQGDYASPAGFELAVSAAATWLAREAGNSDAGELRFSHGAMAGACRVTGREGMMGGLEQLAGLRLGNGLSAGELLRRDWSEVLSQGQSLTVITGTLTPELAGDLLHLAELGVAAEVWCAGGLGGSGQPIQLAARLRERGRYGSGSNAISDKVPAEGGERACQRLNMWSSRPEADWLRRRPRGEVGIRRLRPACGS
ncbi:hypothetical protein HMSSN139_47030 [Paenibacillus sp. HMSSN-139]|nr:hypothetical protein HMSSN139_47030 [Paenibacillus sp. HMSSN-139]